MGDRRLLTIVVAIALFVVVDGVLWFFSVSGGATVRPAFVGAASAWGVAIVGLAAGLLGAFSSAQLGQRAAFTTERRTAYARLLAFAYEYVEANASFKEAGENETKVHEIFNEAKGMLDSNPKDKALLEAVRKATSAWDDAKKRLSSATATVNEQMDAYRSAEAIVELLAPDGVQSALNRFVQSLDDPINRRAARAGFVAAARSDLGLSHEPSALGQGDKSAAQGADKGADLNDISPADVT